MWPSDSMSRYWSRLSRVITYSALSSGNGLISTVPSRQLAGGEANPPVHAGIVPDSLPARSAPTGVRSFFKRSASAGDTFAKTGPEHPNTTAAIAAIIRFRILITSNNGPQDDQSLFNLCAFLPVSKDRFK